MFSQTVCPSGCKVTLVAFVWLFSSVHFQMSPQIGFLSRCKVALFALVWLLSTVHFQMSPQIVGLGGCKVALIALVWPHMIYCLFHWSFYNVIVFAWMVNFKIFVHWKTNKQGRREKKQKRDWTLYIVTSDVFWVLVLSNSDSRWFWNEWKWKLDAYIWYICVRKFSTFV